MKKRILTGIKPTGEQAHIGNYFWAIEPMLRAQQEGNLDVFMFLASLHSFISVHEPEKLRQYYINIVRMYLACGIDPEKSYIYNQAYLPAHTEAGRILGCITNMWTMERMHAYKDSIAKWKANEAAVWLFTYPILMAADILLYDAHYVPVGKDQKQHVEYARDIAEKFNKTFGDTFILPEPIIDEAVATVPGIDGRKMSKSYNNYIGLLDDEKTILKKIKLIPTWSQWIADPKDPDACNVYNILKLFLTKEEDFVLRKRYTDGGLGYKEVKDMLYEKIRALLEPIQERYASYDEASVIRIINAWTEKVRHISEEKIALIKQKIGFFLG